MANATVCSCPLSGLRNLDTLHYQLHTQPLSMNNQQTIAIGTPTADARPILGVLSAVDTDQEN